GPRGEDGFAAVSFDGRVGEGASLKAMGRFAVDPLRLVVSVDTEGFALAPWRERLDFWPAGRVASGSLEAHGSLVFEAGVDDAPATLSWEGAARLADLRLVTTASNADLVQVATMGTDALRLQTN